MRNYYVIGDTHFNHYEMRRYCNRPSDFEARIQKGLMRLNAEDILFHLGDICIGNDREVHERYIVPIKATKILLKGNHDKKTNTWYLRNGWDFVCDTLTDKLFGASILFSHKPMLDNGMYDINIHAHLHNSGHRDEEYLLVKNTKQRLYAPEDFHYKPIPVRYFVEK